MSLFTRDRRLPPVTDPVNHGFASCTEHLPRRPRLVVMCPCGRVYSGTTRDGVVIWQQGASAFAAAGGAL